MIKLTYYIGKKKFEFKEKFIDREEARKLFKDNLYSNNSILYYGVGGVGKSKLKIECIKIFNSLFKKNVLLQVDFSNSHSRSLSDCLITMVSASNCQKFYYFEMAYKKFFKRKNPDLNYGRKKDNIFEKASPVTEITDYFDSGITGKVLKYGSFFMKIIKKISIPKDIKKALKEFDSLTVNEIEDRLPAFLLYDINKINKKKILFVFDNFEILSSGICEPLLKRKNEEWVKKLITEYFADFSICVFGREKISWIKTQYQLLDFNEESSMEYLDSCGIKEIDIKNEIINCCKGYPLYLYLSVETYASILNSNKCPNISDFGGSYETIINRFINNLSENEVDILKLVCIPRYYNYEIYKNLITEFSNKSNLNFFDEFNRFSFIKFEDNKFYIHSVVRKYIIDYYNNEIRYNNINVFMFEYFCELFNKYNDKYTFLELIYHLINCKSKNEFFHLLELDYLDYISNLQKNGEVNFILQVLNIIISKYAIECLPISIFSIYVDIVHLGGNYEASVDMIEKYLLRYTFNDILKSNTLTKLLIRKIHHAMFYAPIIDLLKSCKNILDNKKNINDDNLFELLFLIGGNLGCIYGDFLINKEFLFEAKQIAIQQNDINKMYRVMRKECDIHAYENNPYEAINIIKKCSINFNNPNRYQMYLLGTLGESYRKLNDYDKSKYYFDLLEKKSSEKGIKAWNAHSYLGKAYLNFDYTNKSAFYEYLQKAKIIYNQIGNKWGQISCLILDLIYSKANNLNIENEYFELINQCYRLSYNYYKNFVEEILNNYDLSKNYVKEIYLFFL